MKNICILIGLFILPGCAGPLYVPPQANDAPKIKIVLPKGSGFIMYKNGEDCSGAQNLPKTYLPLEPNALPIPLYADEEVAFSLGQLGVSTAGGFGKYILRGNNFFYSKEQHGILG